MSIGAPEYGAVLDPRGAEPVFQRPDGTVDGSADLTPDAVLVGFRPPDRQNDPLPEPLEINEVNRDELRASEATCKTDE